MIHDLPEGSRLVSAVLYEKSLLPVDESAVEPEPDPRAEFIQDARAWNADRRLLATIANAINQNTLVVGQWEKGKQPVLPVVGPNAWQPQKKQPAPQSDPKDNYDVLRRMGWTG